MFLLVYLNAQLPDEITCFIDVSRWQNTQLYLFIFLQEPRRANTKRVRYGITSQESKKEMACVYRSWCLVEIAWHGCSRLFLVWLPASALVAWAAFKVLVNMVTEVPICQNHLQWLWFHQKKLQQFQSEQKKVIIGFGWNVWHVANSSCSMFSNHCLFSLFTRKTCFS